MHCPRALLSGIGWGQGCSGLHAMQGCSLARVACCRASIMHERSGELESAAYTAVSCAVDALCVYIAVSGTFGTLRYRRTGWTLSGCRR